MFEMWLGKFTPSVSQPLFSSDLVFYNKSLGTGQIKLSPSYENQVGCTNQSPAPAVKEIPHNAK